jgi:hypothetical protein
MHVVLRQRISDLETVIKCNTQDVDMLDKSLVMMKQTLVSWKVIPK